MLRYVARVCRTVLLLFAAGPAVQAAPSGALVVTVTVVRSCAVNTNAEQNPRLFSLICASEATAAPLVEVRGTASLGSMYWMPAVPRSIRKTPAAIVAGGGGASQPHALVTTNDEPAALSLTINF